MKLKSIFFIVVFSTFLFASVNIDDNKLQIEINSGFKTEAKIYGSPLESSKDGVVFVLLHGKASSPDKSHYEELMESLNEAGYSVIAPNMPWTKKWNGTFFDGLDTIKEIASFNKQKGLKTILIGHSLGGATALIYSSKNENKLVDGIVTIAPGHMIHKSNKIKKVTEKSVLKARTMVENNEGNDTTTFKEVNTGKVGEVKMSANAYLSFYDTDVFPNVQDLLENIEIPVLWLAGDEDRLTQVYRMEELFDWLGENEHNSFKLIEGNHKSLLKNSDEEIIAWIEKLK